MRTASRMPATSTYHSGIILVSTDVSHSQCLSPNSLIPIDVDRCGASESSLPWRSSRVMYMGGIGEREECAIRTRLWKTKRPETMKKKQTGETGLEREKEKERKREKVSWIGRANERGGGLGGSYRRRSYARVRRERGQKKTRRTPDRR